MEKEFRREIIEPNNEAAWLALRDQDITSTMSPALFGLSPYQTAFEVYHSKASGVSLPFNDNERVQAGRRMQDFAADTVAEAKGWMVWRADEYVRLPELRIGSSFDYRVETKDMGTGLLEIKAVDWLRYRDTWLPDEAPPHIEIQAQHQLEVYGQYEWCMVVAFTGIYDWHPVLYRRDREFGAAILARVAQFWADVDAGREPRPDFADDNALLKKLHTGGPTFDGTEDHEANALLARYARTKAEKEAAIRDFEEAEGALYDRFRENSEVFGRDYKAKITQVKASPGRKITQDEVGKVVGARAGYPKLTITDLRKKRGVAG